MSQGLYEEWGLARQGRQLWGGSMPEVGVTAFRHRAIGMRLGRTSPERAGPHLGSRLCLHQYKTLDN